MWVLTNRKAAERTGKVQLINATTFWTPMRRSLGDKRRQILHDRAQQILQILRDFKEGEFSKIYPTTLLWLPEDHCRTPAEAELLCHVRPDSSAR